MEIDFLYIAIVLVIILFSMTLHEVMHGFMAFWLGDDTAEREGRLTLNPLKHIDPFLTVLLPVILAVAGGPIFGGAKPVPFNPARVKFDEWGAALVALAGPVTNLLIAAVFFISYQLFDPTRGGVADTFLSTGVLVNLGFFVFNMIPIPPLDGSRVLYALAPEFIRRGMEAVERFGLIFIFLIVLMASSLIGTIMQELIQAIIVGFTVLFGWM